ncbi:MAG: hypothetical protein K5669_06000 [Lachnospiraceae bacterium]|nr:hypothetical protein [Lachnospiraceae bacterium]
MIEFYLKMFGISLALTLLIELGASLLFKIRGKSLFIVALVNLLTNPAVVYIIHIFNMDFPLQLIPEICVIALEGLIYFLFNRREGFSFKKPFMYSLVFNTVSYGLGLIIQKLV